MFIFPKEPFYWGPYLPHRHRTSSSDFFLIVSSPAVLLTHCTKRSLVFSFSLHTQREKERAREKPPRGQPLPLIACKMKFLIAGVLSLAGAGAFAPPSLPTNTRQTAASVTTTFTSTSLFQVGGVGFDINNLYSRDEEDNNEKRNEVMKYLSEVKAPTAFRSDLGDSVLVSGFDPREPSSTEILDFLNDEESAHFQFSKITAHVDDMKLAKKRLIGRNARYTGLLDKLNFSEGAQLPTVQQLAGISSWVAHVPAEENTILNDIVSAAEAVDSVKNVVVLVSGAQHLGVDVMKEAETMLKDKATTFAYTLLMVPEWNDDPESSCAFGIVNVTDATPLGSSDTFSRAESLRLASECLALDNAAGKCVVATAARDVNSLESMLIRGMREIGFSRVEEIEHMVLRGAKVNASCRFPFCSVVCLAIHE